MTNRSSLRRFSSSTSRRAFLRTLASTGVALPLLPGLFPPPGAQAQENTARPVKVSNTFFSRTERERRWTAVRRIMAKPQWNLDAILAPGSGEKAYSQYLTQIGGRGGGADVIFPRDASKPVHAFVGSARNRRFWEKRLTAWQSDGKLLIAEGEGSKSIVEQLKSLGLNRSGTRLGVAKLAGSRFDPEGLVSATLLEKLKSTLPGVEFLPMEKWGADAGPVDEAAMMKGKEEHDAIRAAVAAGEKAIETIRSLARPPSRHQADIWLPTFTAMFAETGEDPTRLSIALDAEANATLGAPTDDPLKDGQIVSQEIDATVQGYRAQVNHSIFVGGPKTPGYDYYRVAMETAIKILHECLASIVPGKTTCGQLADLYAKLVEKLDAEDRSGVVLHSSGIGNLSRPRLGPANSRGDSDIVLAPGMTFDFKPAIRMKRSAVEDAQKENRVAQIGEHVLVTETGVVRLGKRELKPLTTGS
ncbi:MAG TPA: M24 family metallopeptidase [Candidatus Binatia bacterium]|jgi:Xaa-Pro aminopeptidase